MANRNPHYTLIRRHLAETAFDLLIPLLPKGRTTLNHYTDKRRKGRRYAVKLRRVTRDCPQVELFQVAAERAGWKLRVAPVPWAKAAVDLVLYTHI